MIKPPHLLLLLSLILPQAISAAGNDNPIDTTVDETRVKKDFLPIDSAFFLDRATGIRLCRKPDRPPLFPGGIKEMYAWLDENIQYPKAAEVNRIQGRVVVRFIVNEEGKVLHPKVKESVSIDLDREALRVISKIPDFFPAVKDDEFVSVMYEIPVTFRL